MSSNINEKRKSFEYDMLRCDLSCILTKKIVKYGTNDFYRFKDHSVN